jgi:glucose uptake protein GlcU
MNLILKSTLCSVILSDGTTKTVAIIIGIVAAIVLVVVFLAFLRRSRAAHGKSQI